MLGSLRRSGNTEVPPRSPVAFHAPLFHDLVSGLDASARHVVLDLGAASTPMLALLGQSRSRVEIADLAHFGGIKQLNVAGLGSSSSDAADAFLPTRLPDDEFDLIFCWDLPNYLTLDALSTLMRNIAQRSAPGAIVHALIYYSEPDMPERPGRYVPASGGRDLADHNPEQIKIAAPRYSPEDLNLRMGRFVIDRARLLSNGMQEFVFRL